MTSLYVDALELDRTGDHPAMVTWLHTIMPGRYDVKYLGDVQIWQFDFPDANDAMLFKLRWPAK